MPAITIDGLHKAFGTVSALDDLSLTVDEGEFFGLLGPNGAGKTTTIEILTGQIVPDRGQSTVLGIDPVAHPTKVRARVGILPEKESPPSFMTPREYFDFIGAIRDLSHDRTDDQTTSWADRLGFAPHLDTVSSDLSRGQQQKVMIAAAFFHDPAIVFIDEPLANLDPIVQERVKRYLRAYRDAGNTIVLTTHDVDVAADLCSRVAIVHDGRLVADITPSDLPPGDTLLDVFLDRVGSTLDLERAPP